MLSYPEASHGLASMDIILESILKNLGASNPLEEHMETLEEERHSIWTFGSHDPWAVSVSRESASPASG